MTEESYIQPELTKHIFLSPYCIPISHPHPVQAQMHNAPSDSKFHVEGAVGHVDCVWGILFIVVGPVDLALAVLMAFVLIVAWCIVRVLVAHALVVRTVAVVVLVVAGLLVVVAGVFVFVCVCVSVFAFRFFIVVVVFIVGVAVVAVQSIMAGWLAQGSCGIRTALTASDEVGCWWEVGGHGRSNTHGQCDGHPALLEQLLGPVLGCG